MNIDKVPQRWLDVLRSVQRNFPEAVIAGGALRDLDNDRQVKDIDIFVIDRGADVTTMLLDDAMGYPGVVLAEQIQEYENSTNGLVSVVDYSHNKPNLLNGTMDWLVQEAGPNFQFIVIDGAARDAPNFYFPDYLMNDFDIGLCEIYLNGPMIFTTENYRRDKDNKTLTCTPTLGKENRTQERLIRISAKYPEFKSIWNRPAALQNEAETASPFSASDGDLDL